MSSHATTPIQDRASRHKSNLDDARPIFSSNLGSIRSITAENMPILKNLSFQLLELEPKALLEPKWFSNCNLVGYVLEGKTFVSILDTASEMAATAADAGHMFHVRSGALFNIENVGNSKAEILICLRHENPKDFYMSSSGAAFTDAVLANTFDVESSVFRKAQRSSQSKVIIRRQGEPQVPRTAYWPSVHRFEVEEMQPPTFAKGVGSAKKARSQYWKILNNIAMYSLYVEDKGMREIHWHPDTVEMG